MLETNDDEQLNPFQRKVCGFLKEILARQIVLEKHIGRIDARMNAEKSCFGQRTRKPADSYVYQQLDVEDQIELMKFGLPIATLTGLDTFEKNARNESFCAQFGQFCKKSVVWMELDVVKH